jgi:hypothetical protein
MTTLEAAPTDSATTDAFVERLFGAVLGTMICTRCTWATASATTAPSPRAR